MEEIYKDLIEKYRSAFFDPINGGHIYDFLMYRWMENDLNIELEKQEEQTY